MKSVISVDFSTADCEWRKGKPDELHVVPKEIEDSTLAEDLQDALDNDRQVISAKPQSNTKFTVLSEADGVFVLIATKDDRRRK